MTQLQLETVLSALAEKINNLTSTIACQNYEIEQLKKQLEEAKKEKK